MGWVSVKERLPGADQHCLVCHYNSWREILRFDGANWWNVSNRFDREDEIISTEFWPDYWMPLPDPPEDQEDETYMPDLTDLLGK